MTRDELELQSVIGDAVKKYYSDGYIRLTKREAISMIRANRDKYFPMPARGQRLEGVKQQLFARSLSWSMIDILQKSTDEDPVKVIFAYIYAMEDVHCKKRFPDDPSEWSPEVWITTDYMVKAAKTMLDILKVKRRPE